jgi:hypothetical protein
MTTAAAQQGDGLAVIDQLIRVREREISRLTRAEIELRTLRQVRDAIAQGPSRHNVLSGPLPSAKEAVLDVIHAEPSSYTTSQVVEQLAGRIRSRAIDPRRVLRSTVSNLASDGLIKQDEQGRWSLVILPPKPED